MRNIHTELEHLVRHHGWDAILEMAPLSDLQHANGMRLPRGQRGPEKRHCTGCGTECMSAFIARRHCVGLRLQPLHCRRCGQKCETRELARVHHR